MEYDLAFLDTGMLYRGVAWLMLDQGLDPADTIKAGEIAKAFSLEAIEGANIRTRVVGSAASVVAANNTVRAALLEFQRQFAHTPPMAADGNKYQGSVLDGRDIGTVVCPDASVKFFVTASPQARARRRWLELVQQNPTLKQADVLEDLKARDARDASREAAPLAQAEGAHLIDTTHLSIDAAFAAVRSLIDPWIATENT